MSRLSIAVCSASALSLAACQWETGAERQDDVPPAQEGWAHASPDELPSIAAESYLEAGRYLAVVALCNDCHTEGWLPDGAVAESVWLAGYAVGLEGAWGVAFPPNLRLRAQEWTEEEWVEALRTRRAHERVSRIALSVLSEKDAQALYRFLRHLGPVGSHVPEPIEPGQPITQPYVSLRTWPPNTTLRVVEVE